MRWSRFLAPLVAIPCLVAPLAAQATGQITGVVSDRGTGAPISNAGVTILGTTAASTKASCCCRSPTASPSSRAWCGWRLAMRPTPRLRRSPTSAACHGLSGPVGLGATMPLIGACGQRVQARAS